MEHKRNNNPFSIVMDAYEDEAEKLFNEYAEVLPDFEDTDDEILKLKQKFIRSAFAVICMQFLSQEAGYSPYEDMPEFFNRMGFKDQSDACFYLMGQEGVEWDMSESSLRNYTPFDSMLEDLLYKYRNWLLKERIEPSEFIEGIFGDNEPSDFDSWGAQSFFNDY